MVFTTEGPLGGESVEQSATKKGPEQPVGGSSGTGGVPTSSITRKREGDPLAGTGGESIGGAFKEGVTVAGENIKDTGETAFDFFTGQTGVDVGTEIRKDVTGVGSEATEVFNIGPGGTNNNPFDLDNFRQDPGEGNTVTNLFDGGGGGGGGSGPNIPDPEFPNVNLPDVPSPEVDTGGLGAGVALAGLAIGAALLLNGVKVNG